MSEQKPNSSQQQPDENTNFTVSSPDGSVTWTIPLQVSVRFGQPIIASSTPTAKAPDQRSVEFPTDILDTSADTLELDKALTAFLEARTRNYYDEASDQRDRDEYYASLPNVDSLNPTEFFQELKELLSRTHKTQLRYRPFQHLYPWVDLHPDLQVRSIYSGKDFDPQEIIKEDFRTYQIRALRIQQLRQARSTMSEALMAKQLDLLEASLRYNCEHVVPQSWFGKQEPMKGDLHHLFACEVNCNSFRGNHPYFDFPDYRESIRDRCGKLSADKFEPSAGKGAVARATLYFMLRYPGEINQTVKEYKQESLKTLLDWHQTHPVDDYEKHRNMAIFEKQGNRNPLIDFPEWADKIDFRLGLG